MSDENINGETVNTEAPPEKVFVPDDAAESSESEPETVVEKIETAISQGVQWITRKIESL